MQSSEDVENINPKFEIMLDLPGQGVIVTAPGAAGSEYDFISRFFGPKVGVKEVLLLCVFGCHTADVLIVIPKLASA